MELPFAKVIPVSSVLTVKVRPSTVHGDMAVGEYFISIPDLSIRVGLEARFSKSELARCSDPMKLVYSAGCDGLSHFLRDCMEAFTEKVESKQRPEPRAARGTLSVDTVSLMRVKDLEAQLATLQAQYDAREMAAWGISNA